MRASVLLPEQTVYCALHNMEVDEIHPSCIFEMCPCQVVCRNMPRRSIKSGPAELYFWKVTHSNISSTTLKTIK